MRRVTRWKRPKDGDTRTVTKFLWLPMAIRNEVGGVVTTQSRWLEKASWEEEYQASGFSTAHYWRPARWLDLEED
jgi:hypothetical protein